jgi:hypothetical protein
MQSKLFFYCIVSYVSLWRTDLAGTSLCLNAELRSESFFLAVRIST